MNTPTVANTANTASSQANRSSASRKAESAGNPFQQMLSEEISSKSQSAGKPGERAVDATKPNNSSQTSSESSAEKAPEQSGSPAASAADKPQDKTDETIGKEETTEPNASTLPPELAAMVNALLQRQAAANGTGKGDAIDADATDLIGKELAELGRSKQGNAPDADLQVSLASDAPADAELDVLTATASQVSVETGGEEARPTGFSTMLQQMNQAGAARTAATPHAELAPRVGTQGWDQALGQRVVWMASGAEQSASLTLNPPELGPLQVVLNVSNNQANATFVAPHAEVRQALEAAMPKLREMLGEAGIQLDQASVNQGSPQQNEFARPDSGSGSRGHGGRGQGGLESAGSEPMVSQRVTAAGNGLVDTFA